VLTHGTLYRSQAAATGLTVAGVQETYIDVHVVIKNELGAGISRFRRVALCIHDLPPAPEASSRFFDEDAAILVDVGDGLVVNPG